MFNVFVCAPNGKATHVLRAVNGDFRRRQLFQQLQDFPGVLEIEQQQGGQAAYGVLRITFNGNRDILTAAIESAKWKSSDEEAPAVWREALLAKLK